MKAEEHFWHLKGLIPRCIFVWSCRFVFCVKAEGQCWHLKGLIPRWILSWSCRCAFRMKAEEQCWHLKGLRPKWAFSCLRRLDFSVKVEGHCWHLKGFGLIIVFSWIWAWRWGFGVIESGTESLVSAVDKNLSSIVCSLRCWQIYAGNGPPWWSARFIINFFNDDWCPKIGKSENIILLSLDQMIKVVCYILIGRKSIIVSIILVTLMRPRFPFFSWGDWESWVNSGLEWAPPWNFYHSFLSP